MYQRNGIAYRRTTSVGQKIPSDAPERCEMKSIYGDFEIIMNMDETPLYFDFKGVSTVKVKATGNEKLRFTYTYCWSKKIWRSGAWNNFATDGNIQKFGQGPQRKVAGWYVDRRM